MLYGPCELQRYILLLAYIAYILYIPYLKYLYSICITLNIKLYIHIDIFTYASLVYVYIETERPHVSDTGFCCNIFKCLLFSYPLWLVVLFTQAD